MAWAIAWLVAVAAAGSAAAETAVVDPWVDEPPPAAQAAAAYLVFTNDGKDAVTVVGAESPLCERVEFHTTQMDGDIARMRRQESLTVPADGRLALEPGGTHLMLIRPETLNEGDRVPITFEIEGGQRLSVEAVVRAGAHRSHQNHAH